MRCVDLFNRVISAAVAIMAITDSFASAQPLRIANQTKTPDQWALSYALKFAPDEFLFDTLQQSQEAALDRVAALRAWSAHIPWDAADAKVTAILITPERKEDGPVPRPPGKEPANSAGKSDSLPRRLGSDTSGEDSKAESTAIESPSYSRYKSDVVVSFTDGTIRVAGKRGRGTLGPVDAVLLFDGDGTLSIKDLNGTLLSVGTWFQKETELSFVTPSYVYIGNAGTNRARGVRMKNGSRLGSNEEEWNLKLAIADPVVGTWQLATRKGGKQPGDKEEYYTTKLVLRFDHTASVDWTMTAKRMGWNMREQVTDFDQSIARWEIRDGQIHFSQPRIIRNWHGKDNQWSWFDPENPLNIESLKGWERIK